MYLSSKRFGKESCLQFQATAIGHLISKKRMDNFVVESFFKLCKEDLSPFIFESVGSELDHKIISCEHTFVEQGQNQRNPQ